MFEKFDLARGAKILLEDGYQVKPGMEVLVVTDTSNQIQTGEAFARAVHEAGAEAVVMVMSTRRCDGEEPPRSIAAAMKGPNGPDLVLSAARYAFYHAKAVQEARATGTTFGPSMSRGRAEKLGEFNTTIDDLKTIKDTIDHIIAFFKDKDQVHITTPAGSDLTLSVKERPWFGGFFFARTPLFKKKGWDAFPKDYKLPDLLGHSEVACSPIPGSANGTYVVDDWMGGVEAVYHPIIWTIKDGRVVEISGGDEAKCLKDLIQMKDEHAINVAEMALGTNHLITVPRKDYSDKAMLGGMHVGIGTSVGVALQGEIKSEMHEDGVALNITVTADGAPLMKEGKLLL